MNETYKIIEGIKEILINRWPESLPMLDKILNNAENDTDYAQKWDTYLLEGSTLQFQDLVRSFGDLSAGFPAGTEFRNLAYPIDTALYLYRKESFIGSSGRTPKSD